MIRTTKNTKIKSDDDCILLIIVFSTRRARQAGDELRQAFLFLSFLRHEMPSDFINHLRFPFDDVVGIRTGHLVKFLIL